MFETEAKKWVKDNTRIEHSASFGEIKVEPSAEKGFQKGAEYGYNLCLEEKHYLDKHWRSVEERKANEWHYDKNVPCYKTGTYRIIVYDNWREPTIISPNQELEHINGQENHIVAWKEIVLPELPKESE